MAGEAAAVYDISTTADNDLATIIPIAVVAIGLLLALVLRSLVAPLYLIVSVGLSYLAALGLSVLLFIKVAGDGGLVFFLPFLMFIFLLALGEDYNILVMSRIREEAQRLPLKEAVSRAMVATGTTVTSAGLVLGGTLSVFAIVGAQQGSTQFRDVDAGLPGRPYGHLPRPHLAGAVHGRATRPVELVAVGDEQARRRSARRPRRRRATQCPGS